MDSPVFALHGDMLANLPPGSSVMTDASGTHVDLPRIHRSSTARPGPPSETTQYDLSKQITKETFTTFAKPNEPIVRRTSMVIFIDGACKNNGKPDAKAGYGLFFGPGSKYNKSGRLPTTDRQTNQNAEIQAAIEALKIVKREFGEDFTISNIILVTDSNYVVQAMSNWIYEWKDNGWLGTNGSHIVNKNALLMLHNMIDEMAEDGIDVNFWWVPREQNIDADKLAVDATK